MQGPPLGVCHVRYAYACAPYRSKQSLSSTQGENVFVDASGLWWLGDFGSAVIEGRPIHSTTLWFAPAKQLIGKPAKFQYDW